MSVNYTNIIATETIGRGHLDDLNVCLMFNAHCCMSINARSVLVQGLGRDFDFVSESLRKHCCDV